MSLQVNVWGYMMHFQFLPFPLSTCTCTSLVLSALCTCKRGSSDLELIQCLCSVPLIRLQCFCVTIVTYGCKSCALLIYKRTFEMIGKHLSHNINFNMMSHKWAIIAFQQNDSKYRRSPDRYKGLTGNDKTSTVYM